MLRVETMYKVKKLLFNLDFRNSLLRVWETILIDEKKGEFEGVLS